MKSEWVGGGAGGRGEAKVSLAYLTSSSVQLMLAYSWGRSTVLAAGKSRGGCLYSVSSLSFIFLSPMSLSFISSTISSISLLPVSGRRYKVTNKG